MIYKNFLSFLQSYEKSVNYSLIAHLLSLALPKPFTQTSTNNSHFKSVNFRNLFSGEILVEFRESENKS